MLTVTSISRQPLAQPIFYQNQLLILLCPYTSSPLPDHSVVLAVILRILCSQPLSALLPKPTARSSKKSRNVFYDDRGHPYESEAYNQLLHNIDGGTVLGKKKSPTPPIDVNDLTFNHVFPKNYTVNYSGLSSTSPTYYPRMPMPYLP
jgi:hypothetical protein